MDEYKQMAGREAEWGERIPPKAQLWDALQTEIALHERTKQRVAELELRLKGAEARASMATALYDDLKREIEEIA